MPRARRRGLERHAAAQPASAHGRAGPVVAKNDWIAYRRPVESGRPVRLFFFPYAGKGASGYRELADRLGEDIEPVLVQTPGREARLREPAVADMAELVERLA